MKDIFCETRRYICAYNKTVLSITKRSFYRLPLLEEVVLRLINENCRKLMNWRMYWGLIENY